MNGGAPVPEQRSVSGGVPEQPPGPERERVAPADGPLRQDGAGARGPGSAMRYAVLGPVRAWRGGDRLAPGTPQQQALLAVLLLREGRTATAPELIDALWGEDPPSQALPAIRTYASRLRKILDPGDLTSVSGGYALSVPHGALDLTVAQELAAEAEKAAGSGDLGQARALLNKALGLWDGEALAGVPGPHGRTQRTRLEEWRLSLQENLLEMDLEQGCHTEAVSELTALTAAHPLREHLRELLMLALYRSGRQAEALAVYADTHRLLAEELGVDPRAGLRELQSRILAADPALAEPETPAEQPASAPVRPAQLPATVPDFTGRDAFVAELGDALGSVGGRVMAVSAVAGIGGVGKTTLAVHVAHAARAAFPDGQLYVDLQGTDGSAAEPETVLGSFLRALGTPESAVPAGLDERAALYRSTLDGRRVLVLLDNARDAAQIRPLLPGAGGCAALITSRVRMVDLAGAHLVDLDVMSPEEALQLFTRIVGAERVGAEREAALDVVAACGFLPLAIRIAASRLASRRTWTVSVLAAKLADERRRLDELQAGDLAVKATFELGYGQLEPAQARAFRLLGLADGPDISLDAAAALLDLDADATEDLLESLVDTSLLESAAPGRYRYHDLVRLYARACAERDEGPERTATLARLLDFYLSTAAGVYALERPGDQLHAHLAPTEVPGLAFTDRTAAWDWLYREASCLLACVRQHAGGATLRRAVDLLFAAKDLAESGADARQYEQVAAVALAAAEEQEDLLAQARARTTLAHSYRLTGKFAQADEEADHGMRLSAAAGDPVAGGYASNIRGIAAIYRNRHAEARTYLGRAIEEFRADANRPGEASALSNLSRVLLENGESTEAVALAERALAIYNEVGLTWRLANGMYALGLALAASGRHDEAVDQLSGALPVFQENRQPLWEGMTLFRMAEIALDTGEPAKAATLAEQSLAQLRRIGGDWRRGNVLTVLGKALFALGQQGRARACWTEALGVYERLSRPEAAEVRELLAHAPQ
ncbi:BTAD domain-containing putative transcriptional regulator [Streptomyces albidoflavus]